MTQGALNHLFVRAQFIQIRSDATSEPVQAVPVDCRDSWRPDEQTGEPAYRYPSAGPRPCETSHSIAGRRWNFDTYPGFPLAAE